MSSLDIALDMQQALAVQQFAIQTSDEIPISISNLDIEPIRNKTLRSTYSLLGTRIG
jgi:hypothetical protein